MTGRPHLLSGFDRHATPEHTMQDDASESDYRESVESIAKEAWEAGADDEHDRIHESVDGSEWVIYTYRAVRVCLYSKNDDAAFDEMGSDALSGVDSASAVYSRLAYYAMAADVRECLESNREEWDEDKGDADE